VGDTESQSRVVVKNEHLVGLVPWWVAWPFEISCKSIYYTLSSIGILISASPPSTPPPSDQGREVVLCKHTFLGYQALRSLFSCCPRTLWVSIKGLSLRRMGISIAPGRNQHSPSACPLLSPAFTRRLCSKVSGRVHVLSCRKLITLNEQGFELVAEVQRDITPEQAASRLRACPEGHYSDG